MGHIPQGASMIRFYCLLMAFIVLAGCQSSEKAAITPLPPDSPPLAYTELVLRGKAQVAAAHEFFYQDRWDEVKQAAVALQETANRLKDLKTDAVPTVKQPQLAELIKELSEAATQLGEAGAAKDVGKATESFRRLHLVVRQLRVD